MIGVKGQKAGWYPLNAMGRQSGHEPEVIPMPWGFPSDSGMAAVYGRLRRCVRRIGKGGLVFFLLPPCFLF